MADRNDTTYELFYWPSIQGRGEFVRLVLEEAGLDYIDVARQEGGMDELEALLEGDLGQTPGFAVPMLRDGELVISQTANICLYLARHHGLVPEGEASWLHANQLQLTMQDFLTEAHDTHHPISVGEYYEDQKDASKRRAAAFRQQRLPKFFDYFERAVEAPAGDYLLGDQLSYVDLSLFQMVRGLQYAFPNAMEALADQMTRVLAVSDLVAKRPNINAYLASDRRLAFNEHGIFRHYPELDAGAEAHE